MAAKKKVKKKVTKKKVTKKKVTRASSSVGLASPSVGILDGHKDEIIVTGRRVAVKNLRKAARGEFRGDFTRDTFDSRNRFSRVLLQQGRVQLDADWNEQTSISLHHLRNLACDIGSEHWGPRDNAGFKIPERDEIDNDFTIGPGHYYVNGILCEIGLNENGGDITYETQPDFPLPSDQTVEALTRKFEDTNGELRALIYLDVWERHYNYINDDAIREVALGGPDTATRAKVIWQVKVLPVTVDKVEWSNEGNHPLKENYKHFLEVISGVTSSGLGALCAKVKDKKDDDNDPCLIAPESRYRGAENQLYRVEIHNSGLANGYTEKPDPSNATFKWSRENASVVFPITDIQSNLISLEHLGKDCRYGLKSNDWVEVIDDDSVLQNRADNLLQVESVDTENRVVILKDAPENVTSFDESKHPYLRRWDHSDGGKGGIVVSESSDNQGWIELEDGILIKFNSMDTSQDTDPIYRTGDYWLIPARTATGDIEWPHDNQDNAKCIPAHGIIHHYAPLALFDGSKVIDANGESTDVDVDLRRILKQAWEDS